MFRQLQACAHYIRSLMLVMTLFLLAFFLPSFFLYFNGSTQTYAQKNNATMFKLGIENISCDTLKNFILPSGKKCSVALITNQTGKDQKGNRNIDILLSKGIDLRYIFTPKHGFYAESKEAMVEKREDEVTKLPMLSWRDCLHQGALSNNYLKSVDLLLFDMQDSGVRYGYVTTLLEVMQVAKQYNKRLVVLDRPNLLGNSIEGTIAHLMVKDAALTNAAIPLRYGMTIGELAHYFNKYYMHASVALCVVPMAHYHRENSAGLFAALSPNIRSLDSCHCYSFLGLLGEIAPFDVGLGTDKAFRCLALPEKSTLSRSKWHELRQILKECGVETKMCRYYSPRKKDYCSGLSMAIPDINAFSSFSTLLAVVGFFKKEKQSLRLSPQFDGLLGTDKVRKFLEGRLLQSELEMEISAGLRNFFHKAASSCLYSPLPRIMSI